MYIKKKSIAILVFLILFSFFNSIFINALDKDSKEKYLKEADLYYKEQKWGKAIWYYRNYLGKEEKNNSIYYDLLYKIANIYYAKLQKYHYALKIYKEISGKLDTGQNQIVDGRIKNLEKNIDGDLFNYAIEHDMNLSDDKNLFTEIDKIFPENYSVIYRYTRGFDGATKTFKILRSGKLIKILDNNEKEVKSIAFEDFIWLWVDLMLIDWYDVPEEDAIITDFKSETFLKRHPLLVSDASSVKITIFENKKPKKLIRINALEIASEELTDINNYFKKILPLANNNKNCDAEVVIEN